MIVFDRHTGCQVEELDEKHARVIVSMCDSFHDIAVTILVELPEGNILDAKADFLRVPDKMCTETASLMSGLEGVILGRGIRKNALRILGGPTGCVHLVELVIEAAKALIQGMFTIRFRQFSGFEEAKHDLTDEMNGKCYYHTEQAKEAAQKQSKEEN